MTKNLWKIRVPLTKHLYIYELKYLVNSYKAMQANIRETLIYGLICDMSLYAVSEYAPGPDVRTNCSLVFFRGTRTGMRVFCFSTEFVFFSSKFVVNEINANPFRSQNAWGGGVNLAEFIKSCWQTDWNQQHLVSFHGTWNMKADNSSHHFCSKTDNSTR